MQILGLDFTSAPGARKPISCAVCALEGGTLRVIELRALPSFAAFEQQLSEDGPWVAGFDFPFGQPAPLVAALGWPRPWAGYVRHVARLGKQGFEQALTAYKAARPTGQKELLRRTDALARSRSPMKLFNPPVGKMFFQGAPRLLEAGVSVLPCRPNHDGRVALEAYPALIARSFVGGASYKSDERKKQTPARRGAREAIVAGLCSPALHERYGVGVALDDALDARLVADASGDALDALLCAVQAAWAASHPDRSYGIPPDCDPHEGWIVDPALGSIQAGV